ncbi:hypothetical protein QGM71_10490 [Virgibacillus sp. C22-A2]|uniref:Uncharacterized protein n=1 Tax=Virgibacillus tibetensis TaxID=3042313 RepID=A0ABU6KHH5_9BACI|nr:hypothetical protein [Virgibacillus sp. C22-A2]
MGLFINRDSHRAIYKNDGILKEPNQGYFRKDHLSELLKEQQKVNDMLTNSLQGLKFLYEKQGHTHEERWEKVSKQLHGLRASNLEHEKIENHVIKQLKKVENDNQKLHLMMEEGILTEKDLLKRISQMSQTNQEVVTQLSAYASANEQLLLKMEEQHNLQKQMAEQIAKQDGVQEEVVTRLESQEAVTEKISRQIEYFRSVLFERTNHLVEKIEDGYKNTTSYVTRLITGSDGNSKNYMMNQEQKEKQNSNK